MRPLTNHLFSMHLILLLNIYINTFLPFRLGHTQHFFRFFWYKIINTVSACIMSPAFEEILSWRQLIVNKNFFLNCWRLSVDTMKTKVGNFLKSCKQLRTLKLPIISVETRLNDSPIMIIDLI